MKRIISAIFISLTVVLMPTATQAAAPVTSGLTISPALEQLSLSKGQKSISFTSHVTNNTKSQLIINISTTDFTALNESGGVVFLPNLTNRPHGLAQWLKPAITQLVLPVGSSQAVPITITPTPGLASGGHYGALIYRVITPGAAAKGNQVSNNEEVSSLVFLTTATGGTQTIQLGALPLSRIVLKIPSSVNLVLNNTGNTQIAPHGLVTIVDSSNKEVARGVINLDSGLVLPGTSRLYTVPLRTETKLLNPGTYHLVIAYQASATAKLSLYSASFLLINEPILVFAVILVALIILLLIRRYGSGIAYRLRKP